MGLRGGGRGVLLEALVKFLLIKSWICAVYDYTGRADLSKGSHNSLFEILVALARICFSLVLIDRAKIP